MSPVEGPIGLGISRSSAKMEGLTDEPLMSESSKGMAEPSQLVNTSSHHQLH